MRKFILLFAIAAIALNVQTQTIEKKGPWITETAPTNYDYPIDSQNAMNARIDAIAAANQGCTITYNLQKYDYEYWFCGGYCVKFYWKIRYNINCQSLSKDIK